MYFLHPSIRCVIVKIVISLLQSTAAHRLLQMFAPSLATHIHLYVAQAVCLSFLHPNPGSNTIAAYPFLSLALLDHGRTYFVGPSVYYYYMGLITP